MRFTKQGVQFGNPEMIRVKQLLKQFARVCDLSAGPEDLSVTDGVCTRYGRVHLSQAQSTSLQWEGCIGGNAAPKCTTASQPQSLAIF